MNYDGKKFSPVSVSVQGEVSAEVIFRYEQEGEIVTCIYSGGSIASGQLIGLVNLKGEIDMRYQQVLTNGTIQTGICSSTPEILEDGRIRLHEKWKWTCGNFSEGYSILEEV